MFKKPTKCKYCEHEFQRKSEMYKSYLYMWSYADDDWKRVFNPIVQWGIFHDNILSGFIKWFFRSSDWVCRDCYLTNNFSLLKLESGEYKTFEQLLKDDPWHETSETEFHESNKLANEGERKSALVDIDETISHYPGKRSYDLAQPRQDMIDKINKLYDEGWYIIYWTARGGSEASKKAGRCYYDFTYNQLTEWGCKFHELSTGTRGNYIKPATDLVIDDKAITIEELLPIKETKEALLQLEECVVATFPCPNCGRKITKREGCQACDIVWGRRGWRALGVYDG